MPPAARDASEFDSAAHMCDNLPQHSPAANHVLPPGRATRGGCAMLCSATARSICTQKLCYPGGARSAPGLWSVVYARRSCVEAQAAEGGRTRTLYTPFCVL